MQCSSLHEKIEVKSTDGDYIYIIFQLLKSEQIEKKMKVVWLLLSLLHVEVLSQSLNTLIDYMNRNNFSIEKM